MGNCSTEHLKGKAKKIADDICAAFKKRYGEEPDSGGCKTFYSTKEWAARGERWGNGAVLVVVYDGGDFYELLSCNAASYLRPGSFSETMDDLCKKHGCYREHLTSWASALYKI